MQKNHIKKILPTLSRILITTILITSSAQAYFTACGDSATQGETFSVAPGAASFYRPSGDYYFGLSETVGTQQNPDAYQICYGNYRTTKNTPQLVGIGSGISAISNLNSYAVNLMTVISPPSSSTQNCPIVLAGLGIVPTTPLNLYAINKYNTYPIPIPTTGDFLDAAGNNTEGIAAITGSNNIFFTAVRTTTSTNMSFGDLDSGIIPGTLTLSSTYTAQATLYNPNGTTATTTPDAFPVNFTATQNGAFAYNKNAEVPASQTIDMWYDTYLGTSAGESGRLFVAAASTLNQTNATAWSVGTFIVNQDINTLTLTATKSPHPAGDTVNTILCASSGNALPQNITLQTTKVRTMHTSTGLIYLILGGSGIGTSVPTNNVYAIPLVYGSTNATWDGLPANTTIFTNGAFLTPVTQITVAELITTSSAAALVGGFVGTDPNNATGISLPCNPGTADTDGVVTSYITDMYVDNDAVFVAVNDTSATGSSPLSESGIFKSQAVFNDLGQIDHWTDWQKVIPFDMGDYTTSNGGVDFCAVDGYTGHVWAVNKADLVANVTQWTVSNTLTSQPGLAGAVNAALKSPCYSVLDLNASTTCWGADTPSRITVFGGDRAVCFAITGSATANAATLAGTFTSLNTQMPDSAYDWTKTQTLQKFLLPAGSGPVICLGYSSWSSNTTLTTPGFLLAGCAGTATTAPAVYAIIPNGATDNGFATQSLFMPQLVNPAAIQLTAVSGVPVKIQAQGGSIYILTTSVAGDTIYAATRANTVSQLNAQCTPIGISKTAGLATVSKIYDFVISATATATTATATTAPNGLEQLLAATTDGVYSTHCVRGSGATVAGTNGLGVTPINANWSRISSPQTASFLTNNLSNALYERSPQTFWFANFIQNPGLPQSIYNKNIFYQMSHQTLSNNVGTSGIAEATSYQEDPSNIVTFNGATSFDQQTAPEIFQNFPVTARLFYNDGCRRFFIQKSLTDDAKYQILVLPYNLYDYGITTNNKYTMQDSLVAQASAFYWISSIGDTGRLMMGTDRGVIALQ